MERFKLTQKPPPSTLELKTRPEKEEGKIIDNLVNTVGGPVSNVGAALHQRLGEMKGAFVLEDVEKLHAWRQNEKDKTDALPPHKKWLGSKSDQQAHYDLKVSQIRNRLDTFPFLLDANAALLQKPQANLEGTQKFVSGSNGGPRKEWTDESINQAASHICEASNTIKHGSTGAQTGEARDQFLKDQREFMGDYTATVIREAHEKFPGNAILSDAALHHIHGRFEPLDSTQARQGFDAMLARMPAESQKRNEGIRTGFRRTFQPCPSSTGLTSRSPRRRSWPMPKICSSGPSKGNTRRR